MLQSEVIVIKKWIQVLQSEGVATFYELGQVLQSGAIITEKVNTSS